MADCGILILLADQPEAQRDTFGHSAKPVVHRGDVVRGLLDVLSWNARCGLVLEQKKVCQRGLGSFDLRRQNCLLTHIGVQELVGIREQQCDAVKPAERLVCSIEQGLRRDIDFERRTWRQRSGVEDSVALTRDRDLGESARSIR